MLVFGFYRLTVHSMALKNTIKHAFFPTSKAVVGIKNGPFRGIRLMLDPQSNLQLVYGLYEAETYPSIRRMLKRARWLIDVGAGYGELSILFAGQGIPTIAVEPDADARYFLQNMDLNGIRDGRMFRLDRRYVGTAAQANFVTLDELAREWSSLGFIKIDVDGSEVDVLKSGAGILLSRRTACFLVETHSQELERECFELFGRYDYNVSLIDNAWWRVFVPELRPGPQNRWFWAEPRSAASYGLLR